MAKLKNLSPLMEVVQALLMTRCDALYAQEKTAELEGKSSPEILEWACVYLDPRNQRAFASAVGIDPDEMMVLRRAFSAAKWVQRPPAVLGRTVTAGNKELGA